MQRSKESEFKGNSNGIQMELKLNELQTEFHVWTLIVFGVHWCIALLWLVLQDSASESGIKTPSPAVSLFRRALVAYVLVFDWPPRYQQVRFRFLNYSFNLNS